MHLSLPSLLIASAVSAVPHSRFKSIVRRTTCASAGQPINLGLASNYAIFSNTGIADSVPGSASAHIYGDIGVAPIAMTAITGFALTQVTASDDSAKSVYVSGSVYGPAHPISGTSYTPKDVANDMLSAYKCAKSQTATQSWSGAASLDGMTFTKGVYAWSGAVSLGVNAKVYLNGVYGDVFIFNAAGAFSTGAGSSIVLGGTLTSASVYWVGSTSLTTGAASAFAGIILTGTNVVIAGTLDGAVLAQTDVALDSATITLPVTPLPACDTGYERQGSSTTCTSTSSSTTTTTTPGHYARFASYDCDNSPYNTFYGQSPDWVQVAGGKITNGAEVYFRDTPNGSEGYCESQCQKFFPNPNNVVGGFQLFVYVPYSSTGKSLTNGANGDDPFSPFECFCKKNSAQASLSKSSYRSCNLAGTCAQYNHLITDYTSLVGHQGTPICQDVTYSSTTQACSAGNDACIASVA